MDKPKKMTFEANRENNGKLSPIGDRKPFTVMLNPDSLTIESGIDYKTSRRKFLTYTSRQSPKITLPTLYFDVTGVIPKDEWPQGCTTIKQMVDNLKKVVYDPDGESHQPPVVKIYWGEFTYAVRTTKLDIKYTLFDPFGIPIRAEVTIGADFFYQEWPFDHTQEKKSPDLTHLVEVKAGDTLPLMCERVYNDPSYYLQIAKINGLTNFRQLKPGTMLEFPPIRE